jgi:hypothetical protein
MHKPVFEILSWKSAMKVSDNEMIESTRLFINQASRLPGFLHQSLYKEAQGKWLCVYFWENEDHAHQSNELVQNFSTFKNLISLIEEDSISIQVLTPVQSFGNLVLN